MRLHILELDDLGPDARERGVRFRDLFIDWLRPALPEAEFSATLVPAGEPLPAPTDYDAFILTGSRAGVYEDLSWMAPLAAFLREAARLRIPVGGVCFGHQIMAHAHGGAVAKYSGGWNLGQATHTIAPGARELFSGCAELNALSFHQDQVLTPPPSSEVIITSRRSPYGGLRYDFPQMSVQFHPEFQPETVRALLERTGDSAIAPQLKLDACASMDAGDLDNEVVARAFAQFYRDALSARR